jgi:hypothetical protein
MVVLIHPQPARAVEGDALGIRDLDLSRFPQIRFFVSVSNYLGAQPEGLRPSDLELLEDGNRVTEYTLTEEAVGHRLVVVLYPGSDLLGAASEGERRIESIRRIVTEWFSRQTGVESDDFSYITSDRTVLLHSSDSNALMAALQREQPSLPTKRPLGVLLAEAIAVASDPLPRPGMRSAILLFTAAAPGIEDQSICPRIRELNIFTYGIWAGANDPVRNDVVAAWANACGGYFGSLNNEPGLLSLLNGISSQQKQYVVEYRSKAAQSGNHVIRIAMRHGFFNAESRPIPYPINVKPPVVTFAHLPTTITRSGTGPLQTAAEFEPAVEGLEAQILFPDGYTRKIEGMKLYVDGEQIAECTMLPCPALRWNLQSYADSGVHTVRLLVRDELGLEGDTSEQEVNLVVFYPSLEEMFWARYAEPLAIAIAILILTVILAIVPALVGTWRHKNRRLALYPGRSPLVPSRLSWWEVMQLWWSAHRRERQDEKVAPEWILQPGNASLVTISLILADVLVGSDSKQVDICLPESSVSPQHARFSRMAVCEWRVFDMGSVAGTWVNGDEIPADGYVLREGDALQIGRCIFYMRYSPHARDGLSDGKG